jgi:phosphoribosylaminoimidazole-succinocarboxamide synthase
LEALKETHFRFPGQTGFYRGKVRDVYYFGDKMLMIASDRISAFDVVLPKAIPCKGQILNQIAFQNLEATKDIVPNWSVSQPDPMATFGWQCEPYAVEMVVRGYLVGHAWRTYQSGKRDLCGVPLPDGMKENDAFPSPIITPSTKAKEGHDMDISREEIMKQGIVSKEEYEQLEQYTLKLFERGTQLAAQRGLILVDTKYEFGKRDGKIFLIDEIHTPDSSRYFYLDGYAERQLKSEKQKQLSKEFVREWLMSNGFQGKEGQQVPEMTDVIVEGITNRYVELYEKVTGKTFKKYESDDIEHRIEKNVSKLFVNL